jgi:hypothetical protein
MHGRALLGITAIALLPLCGCSDDTLIAEPERPTHPAANSAFDAADTGAITGRVVWEGPVPDVPPIVTISSPDGNLAADGKLLSREPNPFAPRIEAATRGVGGAVVFLREIDPSRAKPWDHEAVRVEIVQRQIRVLQPAGLAVSPRVGFVRRGDAIEVVNRDARHHSLRARGAAFFGLPLVETDKVSRRTLDKPGLVTLSSGAGYPWMHAHLFVVDHPYYTRTDREGHFRLEQVPPGNYEVVCWMPSWKVERKGRDPESFQVARIAFAPPMEHAVSINVRRADTVDLRFVWDTDGVRR